MNQNISKIHREILDEKRRSLLDLIAPISDDFVLGGGTALALQLKHRLSFDFDFFTPDNIPPKLLDRLIAKLNSVTVSLDNKDELTLFDENQIKISYIHYPFKSLYPKITTGSVNLFDLKDIAIQKAYTIGRRGTWRDYYDLYTLLSRKLVSFDEIIRDAKIVYQDSFNPKLFLEQLIYFDDITDFEIIPVSSKDKPVSRDTIEKYFQSLVEIKLSSI